MCWCYGLEHRSEDDRVLPLCPLRVQNCRLDTLLTEIILWLCLQVMLTKSDANTSSLLVNGSRGVVRGFQSKSAAIAAVKDDLNKLRSGSLAAVTAEARALAASRESDLVSRLAALQSGREAEFPVVWFSEAKREKIIGPESFESEVYMMGTCVRTQIPLQLAWALTMHKSQGATLDKVCVELDGCFAPGQVQHCSPPAHAHLSRSTTHACTCI